MAVNFKGNFRNKGSKVDFNLPVIKFKEDDVFFLYSPALDLTGYGVTEKEAQKSFEETLGQFLDYSTKKNTLLSELRKLGWKVSKKQLRSPSLVDMLSKNRYLAEIFEAKDYSKFKRKVSIPAIA